MDFLGGIWRFLFLTCTALESNVFLVDIQNAMFNMFSPQSQVGPMTTTMIIQRVIFAQSFSNSNSSFLSVRLLESILS